MTEAQYENLTLLGQSGAPAQKKLEVFPAPGIDESRPGRAALITFFAPECTSMCPITHQPDFWTMKLEYIPDEVCLESKSLKLFLQTFREEGVFCEQLAADLKTAFIEVLQPLWIRVTVTQAPRGGIGLEVVSGWHKGKGEFGGRGSDVWSNR